jgi:hypothetical protein
VTRYRTYVKCLDAMHGIGINPAAIVCYNLFMMYGERSVLALARLAKMGLLKKKSS